MSGTDAPPVKVLGLHGRRVVVRVERGGVCADIEIRTGRLSSLGLQLMSLAPAEEWARFRPSGDSRLFDSLAVYDALLRAAELAGQVKRMPDWHV